MIFTNTNLKGLVVIEPEYHFDERGFFSRIVCQDEFKQHGLENTWLQQNISFNKDKGTLRGMHLQKGEAAEIKIVRCTQGSVFDVAVDLRENSETYLKYFGIELSSKNHKQLYIPKGFAHGFITLCDNCELTYLMSQKYMPGYSCGFRYDDPKFNIDWPITVNCISEKDKNWSLL